MVAQVQVSPQARALLLGGISPSRGGKSGPQKTRLSSKLWDLKTWKRGLCRGEDGDETTLY